MDHGLITVHTFYKNNLESGLAFGLELDGDCNFLKSLFPVGQAWLNTAAKMGLSLNQFLDEVEEQVQEIADNWHSMDTSIADQSSLIFITDIEILGQLGRIPCDEYNGNLYSTRGKAPFIPSTYTWPGNEDGS